jgi:hypothetical protein
MDDEVHLLLQQLEDEEEEMEQDMQMQTAVAVSIVLIGAEEAHQLRVQRRQPSRLYLCREQLLHHKKSPNLARPK